jgi:cytochrome c
MSRFRKLFIGATLALVAVAPVFAQGKLGLGRPALPEEVAAWDIDVRPDGHGLPPGKGSVKQGEELYIAQCASCHGDFGQGEGRWPVLAGGKGTLKAERPEKTIGSFWPFTATVFDYVKRAMPYGNARALSDDEVYAITAFLLNLNDLVPDSFVLSKENFLSVTLPNQPAFYPDDRETTEKHFWNRTPCMSNCKADTKVLNRARILDVTPEDMGKSVRVE